MQRLIACDAEINPQADVLHGDIRLPNLCVTASGKASVVDFSHATKNRSRKEKAIEIKGLAYFLGMDLPTEPAAIDVEKAVVIRHSARIKELEQKSKVEPKTSRSNVENPPVENKSG